MSSFINFNFDEKILTTLQEIGFDTPTPIQELTIPKVLEGVDIIASAQTGTGKTAAFMLPILHLLSNPSYKGTGGPQVLILVPTRELAMQVADEAKKFSKNLPKIKTVCIYGGVPYPVQRKALATRYEILVATPGRLMDHMNQGRIDLSYIKLFVLDEADRMLDMGFFDAVEQISNAVPRTRQTLLFSATIDKKILPFSKQLQNNAHEIKAEFSQTAQNNIEQRLYYVDNIGHKMRLIEHIIENTEINQAIIFTSTIQQANELADHLQDKGYQSEALHGDMNQRQRSRTISRLREGKIQFLIATDVASRGIDIASLSHIINFDLPFQAEDFIHRIGRTGRAGAKGVAITFTTYKEELKLLKINKLIGKSIELHTIEGMAPQPKGVKNSAPRRQRPNSRFNSSSAPRRENGFSFQRNDSDRAFSVKPKRDGEYSSQRRESNRPSTSRATDESEFNFRKEESPRFSSKKPRHEGNFNSKREESPRFSSKKPRNEGDYSSQKEGSFRFPAKKSRSEAEYSSPRGDSYRFSSKKPRGENEFSSQRREFNRSSSMKLKGEGAYASPRKESARPSLSFPKMGNKSRNPKTFN